MEFSHNDRPRGVLIMLFLVCSLIMTACSGPGGPAQDSGRDRVLSFIKPLRTDSPEGDLYDLTGLIEDQEGTLLSCGLFDETHLVLLYSADESADSSLTHCQIRLLDLEDGSVTDLAAFDRMPGSGDTDEEEWDAEGISFLSADPLSVYDRRGVLYLPGQTPDKVILPSWFSDAEIYALDGRLWLSSGRGIICGLTAGGLSEPVWKLPYTYGSLTPVVTGHAGKLSFVTALRTDPSERIFVDVDPVSGESAYYQCDMDPGRYLAFESGRLMGTSFRTEPVISVCVPADGAKKELVLPDSVQDMLRGGAAAQSPENTAGNIVFAPGSPAMCGDWCLWTLRDPVTGPVRVFLWDTAACKSTGWKAPDPVPYTEAPAADYGDLSRRAADLEDRYSVRIVLGANIPSEFSDYAAQPVTDAPVIDGSLSVLDNVLSLYPDGYFDALKGSYYRDIVFYLTGPLTPHNADSNISNASAFATESDGVMQLAFDLYDDLAPDTVIHELTHSADYRFLGEGIWDEEAWNSMNPEGFSYYEAYIDENGESYETAGSPDHTAMDGWPADEVYFIDPYSKTYAMEDRARLMENLLAGSSPYKYCFSGEHVREKLGFYFRFLRKTLGDEGWPSLTSWEEALESASPAD